MIKPGDKSKFLSWTWGEWFSWELFLQNLTSIFFLICFDSKIPKISEYYDIWILKFIFSSSSSVSLSSISCKLFLNSLAERKFLFHFLLLNEDVSYPHFVMLSFQPQNWWPCTTFSLINGASCNGSQDMVTSWFTLPLKSAWLSLLWKMREWR